MGFLGIFFFRLTPICSHFAARQNVRLAVMASLIRVLWLRLFFSFARFTLPPFLKHFHVVSFITSFFSSSFLSILLILSLSILVSVLFSLFFYIILSLVLPVSLFLCSTSSPLFVIHCLSFSPLTLNLSHCFTQTLSLSLSLSDFLSSLSITDSLPYSFSFVDVLFVPLSFSFSYALYHWFSVYLSRALALLFL